MSYVDVFGNEAIAAAEASYRGVALIGNLTLVWPDDAAPGEAAVASVIEATSQSADSAITLPDARRASPGTSIIFVNSTDAPLVIRTAVGDTLVTLPQGTAFGVIMRANLTAGGSWLSYQLGAGTSQANAGALAGPAIIALGSQLAVSLEVGTTSSSFTLSVNERGLMLVYVGGAGTFTLPSPLSLGPGWFVGIRNQGSGALTLQPAVGVMINGLAPGTGLTIAPGDSCILAASSNSYFTFGLGPQATGNFSFLSIAVPGSGNYTLSGPELNRIAYRFSGALTGNRDIIVPPTVQEYWIDNATTGAFTFGVRTATQPSPGVVVPPGTRAILYSDGNNVLQADTNTSTFPLTIGQGGTGATNSLNALINLGGTTVGRAVFTAADAAAARAALNVSNLDDAIAFAVALG